MAEKGILQEIAEKTEERIQVQKRELSPDRMKKEALEKAEKPFFEIHISHGGRAVFVEMINSCEIKEGNILKTKKADLQVLWRY